jgi:hypothetical protein
LGEPPNPPEMGVAPLYGSLVDFKGLHVLNDPEVKGLCKKANRLIRKYPLRQESPKLVEPSQLGAFQFL